MQRNELVEMICTPLAPIIINRIKRRRTELRKLQKMIRLDEIIHHLENHPRLVEEWGFYSQDKRASGGYYLEFEVDKRIFGFFDGKTSNNIIECDDPTLVVALFIIFESQIHDLIFHTSSRITL